MTMIQVKQINTYYTQMGEGYDVVCLVGWGQDTRMFGKVMYLVMTRVLYGQRPIQALVFLLRARHRRRGMA